MLGLLASIVPAIGNIVGEVIEDKDKALKVQAKIVSAMIDQNSELFKAQSSIITAEASSESWLAQSWRPITMLVFVTIIANNFIVVPYATAFGFPVPVLPIPDNMWGLLTVGIGGYIGSRGVEKVTKTIADAGGVRKLIKG